MTGTEHRPLDEILHHCIHCGMCLPVCPTYALTSREQSSPRGRIRLIRSVREEKLGLTPEFVSEMNFCLDCQACETACPAGVMYGSLVEDARRMIHERRKEPAKLRFLKWVLLRVILASKRRTNYAGRLLRLYGNTGLMEAVQRSGLLERISPRLSRTHRLLPRLPEKFFDETVPETLRPAGPVRGRVALLTGCVMNILQTETHRDTVAVLLRNGFEVFIPRLQECCGSLHSHNGDLAAARRLARKNIDLFDKSEFDALIVDSAGCGAFIKEYGEVLSGDPAYSARAESLSARTKEITEFLAEVGYDKPAWPVRKRVTYHEACHLVHTQKISAQPREIIHSIPGIEFVELPEATWCCGSAGIYTVTRFDDSMALLERKMNNLKSTGAEIVLTANPGCHLQLTVGIRNLGLAMEVMHPVSLLRLAYG
jgi:glycolate dehydrogenase iron-sulfur subunit